MYSLKSLYTDATLPVKSIFLGLLCGILTWTVLDAFQSRHLKEMLLERAREHLHQEAASNRMIFHHYLKQHGQLTKLIAAYQPLVTWLDQRQDNTRASEPGRDEKEHPDWLPPLSTWRGLIDPRYFLLYDADGHRHAIYRLAEHDLPADSALQDTLSTGRSEGQVHLVSLAGQPYLITSSAINNPRGRKLGTLTLISRLDDEFVSKLNYATDAPNVILALFEGAGERLLSSSQPQRLVSGVQLEQLQRDYLVTGKPFFDYGNSELRLQLATLIPLDQMATLNASIHNAVQQQHLVSAVAFTLTFTLLIFFWSRRIERVLRHIHDFSQRMVGASRAFRVRGDLLWQLERDIVRLTDEVLEARESLREQHVTLQRLKQLELLETVADHLGIGVVLLGPERVVELQTQVVDRFERKLGALWYRPYVERSPRKGELDLKDEQQNQYSFNISCLSLFEQDDVILIQEVTDQKRLHKRLRDQEQQFRHITQSARDAIISIDDANIVIFWNRAAEGMFQYSASEIEGTSITRIVPASYREAHRAGMQRMAEAPASHYVSKTMELEGLRKDGATFPLEISLSTWQMDEKRYFTGILRDITERKQAEQSLQESQSRFALFMDHLPAAVFIKDIDSRVLYVNQYMKTHFDAGDWQGKSTSEHFPVEVAEQLVRDDHRALAEGQYEVVESLKDRAGQERTFRTHKFVIPRPDGEEALLGGIAWDITNALEASEALRRSERRYREIFETAEEGIWLIDAEANTIEVNDRMARMLGYTIDEMRGRHLLDFMDSQAYEEAAVFFDRRRKGIAEKHDFRFLTKADVDCWTIVSTTPMYDTTGRYAGALGMITDITERKRAEDALRAHEEQLRLILASTGEGIFGLDMNGRCTFANRACVETLGFAEEDDLLGNKMHELIHHTRHDGTNYPVEECPTYRSCTQCHITFADDELLWRADGSTFHAEYQSYPMLQDDSVVGAVVSFADITERKRAEAALKQERDFAECLIETAPVIVLVLDPEGRIMRFNSFMEKLSGYSLAEVMGQSWFDTFLVKRDVPRVADVFAKATGEVPTSGNLNPIVTRDGQEHLIAWYNATLRDSEGKLTAVLAIGHDVTEQKAKEAQLFQAQKMEMVGQLTGGIAHDFNNLLTVILGNLKFLAKAVGPECDADVLDLLEDALSAAQDGAELTQRLLAFSRKEPLRRKRIDVPLFLHHFQRFLRRTLGADITVQVDVEADPDLHYLLCDPSQLESALLNLALNSRDAMPHGGRLCLRAAAKQAADMDPTLKPGAYIELAVIDTGEGMAPDHLARAIEPFYTTKGSKQGSGLGLSMVFGFCEHAGGRFQLASESGVGTRATIILPLDALGGREIAQAHDTTPEDMTGKGTILVVEDEERVRKLAGRYLKEIGYAVLLAENGEAAIEALQSESRIELVFSDIAMPGKINGYDLYRWVNEKRPEVKVLLTTGLRSAEIKDLAEGDESPVPITLPKPYAREQLAAAIRDVFGAHHNSTRDRL